MAGDVSPVVMFHMKYGTDTGHLTTWNPMIIFWASFVIQIKIWTLDRSFTRAVVVGPASDESFLLM